MWGECTTAAFGQDCTVDEYDNGDLVIRPAAGAPLDVPGDAGGWYWGDSDLETRCSADRVAGGLHDAGCPPSARSRPQVIIAAIGWRRCRLRSRT